VSRWAGALSIGRRATTLLHGGERGKATSQTLGVGFSGRGGTDGKHGSEHSEDKCEVHGVIEAMKCLSSNALGLDGNGLRTTRPPR